VGWAWLLSGGLSRFIYNPEMNDSNYDRFVKTASKADPNSMFEMLFNYKFGIREVLNGLLKSPLV